MIACHFLLAAVVLIALIVHGPTTGRLVVLV